MTAIDVAEMRRAEFRMSIQRSYEGAKPIDASVQTALHDVIDQVEARSWIAACTRTFNRRCASVAATSVRAPGITAASGTLCVRHIACKTGMFSITAAGVSPCM